MTCRPYLVGDIIAVTWGKGAISCKVLEKGVAETKSGKKIYFREMDVIWVLGKTGIWPKFVKFRGEEPQNVDTNTGAEGQPETEGVCQTENED
jgi:hypothetical protein